MCQTGDIFTEIPLPSKWQLLNAMSLTLVPTKLFCQNSADGSVANVIELPNTYSPKNFTLLNSESVIPDNVT